MLSCSFSSRSFISSRMLCLLLVFTLLPPLHVTDTGPIIQEPSLPSSVLPSSIVERSKRNYQLCIFPCSHEKPSYRAVAKHQIQLENPGGDLLLLKRVSLPRSNFSLPPALPAWSVVVKSRGASASCLAIAVTLQKNAKKGEVKKKSKRHLRPWFIFQPQNSVAGALLKGMLIKKHTNKKCHLTFDIYLLPHPADKN